MTNIEPQPSTFEPIRLSVIELGRPLPRLEAFDAKTRQRYRLAHVLARLHDHPLGLVRLRLDDDGLRAEALAAHLWEALSAQIREHLRHDGLPDVTTLTAAGLGGSEKPQCVRLRDAWLATAPPTTVVIATHNRRESLAVCLEALLASEYPDFEVIVVDNAPKDNTTLDFIRDHYGDASQSGRKVRYVREDRPGLGRAHNAGLPHVTTRHVVFTDDDVLVDRYWLLEMVKGFSMADNVACVTGLILPAELETQAQVWIEQYGGFSKGFTRRCFDLNGNRPPNSPLYPYTAGVFGSGASMAFDTAVLRHLGGFDAALGAGTQALGGDDLAAFFHVVQNGYRLVYEPAAILHHSHRREYAGLRRQAYGYGVGLTAYLTKVVLDHPRLIMDMALRLPAGLAHIFSSKSPKNKHKQADYPKELNTLERKGMLYGPLAYWRSRRAR